MASELGLQLICAELNQFLKSDLLDIIVFKKLPDLSSNIHRYVDKVQNKPVATEKTDFSDKTDVCTHTALNR